MSGQTLQNKDTFNLVGVTFEQDIRWDRHISSIASAASKKLGFLFRAKKYSTSSNLYTLYVAQIQPSLEYCSHVWGAAPPTTLNILDSVQRRAIRLINDSALTDRLPLLAHRRAVGDLSLFYRYFHGLCSNELNSIIPPVIVPSRHTRSASRLHPFAVSLTTSRTSHFDRTFVPRTSRLWNNLPPQVFPSPPNLQTFKSRINKLPLVSL